MRAGTVDRERGNIEILVASLLGATGTSETSYLGEADWSLCGATQRSLYHWSSLESQGEYLELTCERGWWVEGLQSLMSDSDVGRRSARTVRDGSVLHSYHPPPQQQYC